MAVVLDEYGGVSGIITINDLVEQLVGDLEDDDQLIEKIDDGVWRIHGSALLEDISYELGIPLIFEEYETLNGLIFHTLEKIPEDGSDIRLEIENMNISVTEIKDHQVETAIISIDNEKVD